MAKAETSTFLGAMLSAGLYKRNQGKLVRQATGGVIAAVTAIGAYLLQLSFLANQPDPIRFGVPIAITVIGCWFAYRVVQFPMFADFLTEVQSEMGKVSWPSRDELYRATAVVIGMMFALAGILFTYDVVWQILLKSIKVIRF